jgi:hypothetical protein
MMVFICFGGIGIIGGPGFCIDYYLFDCGEDIIEFFIGHSRMKGETDPAGFFREVPMVNFI